MSSIVLCDILHGLKLWSTVNSMILCICMQASCMIPRQIVGATDPQAHPSRPPAETLEGSRALQQASMSRIMCTSLLSRAGAEALLLGGAGACYPRVCSLPAQSSRSCHGPFKAHEGTFLHVVDWHQQCMVCS